MKRQRQPLKHGPYGGETTYYGTAYDDLADLGGEDKLGRIVKLTVYVDSKKEYVRGLSVMYAKRTAEIKHGYSGADATPYTIELLPTEYIKGIKIGVVTDRLSKRVGGQAPYGHIEWSDGRSWIQDLEFFTSDSNRPQTTYGKPYTDQISSTDPKPNHTYEIRHMINVDSDSRVSAFFGRADEKNWMYQLGFYSSRKEKKPGSSAVSAEGNKVNPVEGCRVGTLVRGSTPEPQNHLLEGSITQFTALDESSKFLSGQNRYVHDESTNMGSLGISGGYGVAGIAKVTAAVSAYVGRSTAHTGRSVGMSYNVYRSSGFESLDIHSLSVGQFIAALKKGPRASLLKTLKTYNAVQKLLSKPSTDRTEDKTNLSSALKEWSGAVDDFLAAYGDGFVTAVHWGAYGTVTFSFSSKTDATSWKYGGDAEFSYAGVGAAVALKAAYDGSKDEATGEARVTVRTQVFGSAIAEEIDRWSKTFEETAFANVTSLDNVISKAPDMNPRPLAKPELPAFVEPAAGADVTKALEETKDGSAGAALAEEATKGAAFEKEKEKKTDLTKEAFEKEAEEKVDTKDATLPKLAQAADDAINEKLKTDAAPSAPEHNRDVVAGERSAPRVASRAGTEAAAAADRPTEPPTVAPAGLVPLGILMCSWSELFPWLSRAIDNGLGDLPEVKLIMQWRVMIQDALALSSIYYVADAVDLDFPDQPSLLDLGDSFAKMANTLQSFDPTKKDDKSREDYINEALGYLTPTEKQIYKTWASNSLLRRAELGLGVVYRDRNSPETIDHYTPRDSGEIFSDIARKASNFALSSQNYASFSRDVKVWPIIFPDGSIRAFCDAGYLGRSVDSKDVFSFSVLELVQTVKDHRQNNLTLAQASDIAQQNGWRLATPKEATAAWENGSLHAFGWFMLADGSFCVPIQTPQGEPQMPRGLHHTPSDGSHGNQGFLYVVGVNAPKVVGRSFELKTNASGYLEDSNLRVEFHPIPLDAAKGGVKWKGAATGIVSVTSFTDLRESLSPKGTLGDLEGKPKRSFKNDSARTFNKENLGAIRANDYYLGLVEKANRMKLFDKTSRSTVAG